MCFVCFLTSCKVFTFYPDKESQTYNKTSSEDIKIYAGDIDRPYTIIGSVAADVLGNGEQVGKFLRSKAAKLGADAIIFAELNKLNTYNIRTGISGVAIKFK